MCRVRIGPRSGNVGVVSAACGRLKEEDAMPAKGAAPVAYLGIKAGRGRTAHARSILRANASPSGSSGQQDRRHRPAARARRLRRVVVINQRCNIGALILACAHAHETPVTICHDMPRRRPTGGFPASRGLMPSTPR